MSRVQELTSCPHQRADIVYLNDISANNNLTINLP